MPFVSVQFFVFLLLAFVLYWHLFSKKLFSQNIFLLLAGFIFYAAWNPVFLLLLVFLSTSDYSIGLYIEKTNKQRHKFLLFLISIFINIGVLIIFKYLNFFADSLVKLGSILGFTLNIRYLNIILPLGLSFYVLKSLGYVIDVYKSRVHAEKNYLNHLLFVSFFPQLLAGPIDRAKNLLPQLNKLRVFDYSLIVRGFQLILVGLFKKIVIADNLVPLVSALFDTPEQAGSGQLILGTIAFAIQLYCDFSGYSDMAIGTGRLFGLESVKNFNRPYFSTSISGFWSRWHISLSFWFRDYVFLPIAWFLSDKMKKNKYFGVKTEFILYAIAVTITFLLTGLWHGANYTFIVWGLIFALFLIIVRAWQNKVRKLRKRLKIRKNNIVLTAISVLITFSAVSFNWIFFRSEHLASAFERINVIFTKTSRIGLPDWDASISKPWLFLSCLMMFILMEIFSAGGNLDEKLYKSKTSIRWIFYFALACGILFAGAFNLNQGFYYSKF